MHRYLPTRHPLTLLAVLALTPIGACADDPQAPPPDEAVPLASEENDDTTCDRSVDLLNGLKVYVSACTDDPACFATDTSCPDGTSPDPLRGNRCSGAAVTTAVAGSCPAGFEYDSDTDQCASLLPRSCSVDNDCPQGAFCNYDEGGVCDYQCLPAGDCSGSSCCAAGELCDCTGRCVDPAAPPVQRPSRQPGLSHAPEAIVWERTSTVGTEADVAVPVNVELPVSAESDAPLTVAVHAGAGLQVHCTISNDDPKPTDTSTYRQRCTLNFPAGHEGTRRVYVTPYDLTADAGTGDQVNSVELRYKDGNTVVKPVVVSIRDPQPDPGPSPTTGVYAGSIEVIDHGVVFGDTITRRFGDTPAYGRDRAKLIVAEVTVGDVTFGDYAGPGVTVVIIDESRSISPSGLLRATYLVDLENPGTPPTQVVLDGDRPFVGEVNGAPTDDDVALSFSQVHDTSDLHSITWDQDRGVLSGVFGLRLDGTARSTDPDTPSPFLAWRFTLNRTGDLDAPRPLDGTKATVDADLRVLDWGGAMKAVFDPQGVNWMGWVDATGSGTAAACGVASVAGEDLFTWTCERTLGTHYDTLDPTTLCTSIADAFWAAEFDPTPPYDFEIFTQRYVPCVDEPGHPYGCESTYCDATRAVTVDIDGSPVSIQPCLADGVGDDPALEGPTDLLGWDNHRRARCVDLMLGFDGTRGLADSAGVRMDTRVEPYSRDLGFRNALGEATVPRALGLHHAADRRELGYDGPPQFEMGPMLAVCMQDLAAEPPDWASLQALDLEARVSAVFDTAGCLGAGNYFGSLDHLIQLTEDPTYARILMHRLAQWLEIHELLAREYTRLAAARRALGDASTNELSSALSDLPEWEEMLDRVEAGLALILHPEIQSAIWSIPSEYWQDIDYRPYAGADPDELDHRDPAKRGLPVQLLLTTAAYLELIGEHVREARANAFGQPSAGDLDPRDPEGLRVGDAAAAIALGLANHTRPGPNSGSAPAPWQQGLNNARREFELRRGQLVDEITAHINHENPLEIDERDLPVYFIDPQGVNSRFFATSDYLLSHWATPALSELQSAYAAMTSSGLAYLSRQVQEEQTEQDYERRIEGLKLQYGGQVAEICGGTVPALDVYESWSQTDPDSFDDRQCFLTEAEHCPQILERLQQVTAANAETPGFTCPAPGTVDIPAVRSAVCVESALTFLHDQSPFSLLLWGDNGNAVSFSDGFDSPEVETALQSPAWDTWKYEDKLQVSHPSHFVHSEVRFAGDGPHASTIQGMSLADWVVPSSLLLPGGATDADPDDDVVSPSEFIHIVADGFVEVFGSEFHVSALRRFSASFGGSWPTFAFGRVPLVEAEDVNDALHNVQPIGCGALLGTKTSDGWRFTETAAIVAHVAGAATLEDRLSAWWSSVAVGDVNSDSTLAAFIRDCGPEPTSTECRSVRGGMLAYLRAIDDRCDAFVNDTAVPIEYAPEDLLLAPVDPEIAAQCFKGRMGEQYLTVISARERVRIATTNYRSQQRVFASQVQFCDGLVDTNDQITEATKRLNKAIHAQQETGGLLAAVGSFMGGIANPASLMSGLTGAAAALDTRATEAEAEYREVLQQLQAQQAESACWLEVDKLRHGMSTQVEAARAAVIDVTLAVTNRNNLSSRLSRTLAESRVTVNREAARVLAPLDSAYHDSYVYDFERFERLLSWSKRLTYLAMLAVEYEAQASLGLRQEILAASNPEDLAQVIEQLQREQATRSINGQRPEEGRQVLSLRDEILRISDRDEPAIGEWQISASERFTNLLLDETSTVYDEHGNRIGKGIRFSLTPDGALEHRCAERLWSVNATVVGDLLGATSPSVPLFVLKQNTFQSQWCDGRGPSGEEFQTASLRPYVNLFKGEDIGDDLDQVEMYSWAYVDGWINVKRKDFYSDAYREGASDELAGRGLYGTYMLVIPEFDGEPVIALDRVEDVLLRFDYISVSDGSGSLSGGSSVGASGNGSVTLLSDGASCAVDAQCASGYCNAGRCCQGACGFYQCGGAPDYACLTTCGDDTDCKDGFVCAEGSCTWPLSDGQSCSDDAQCASGHCKAGVCCESACPSSAFCATGVCSPVCTEHAECGDNYYCNGSECVPQLADGAACTEAEMCGSGFCVDDVCCDSSCSGGCEACNTLSAEGTCTALDPAECITPVQMAIGNSHMCAMCGSGQVRCWGSNVDGVLGAADATTIGGDEADKSTTATTLPAFPAAAVGLTAGDYFNCAVLANGQVSCWGNNESGQAAIGDQLPASTPPGLVQTDATPTYLASATAVSAGDNHVCAISAANEVICWGDNYSNAAILGTASNEVYFATANVDGLTGSAVSVGEKHTCVLGLDSRVRCVKCTSNTQCKIWLLGQGTTGGPEVANTTDDGPLTGVVAIASAAKTNYALLDDGTVVAWGESGFGQCGYGTTADRTYPVQVLEPGGAGPLTGATAIAAGDDHACALRTDGSVVCWGRNSAGQLGDGTTTNATTPVAMTLPGGATAVRVEAGPSHTCVSFDDGSVYCVGSNYYGELGPGVVGTGSGLTNHITASAVCQ